MEDVIDQFRDRRHKLLTQIANDRPDLVPLYKTASTGEDEPLPVTSFADPVGRKFPIHNEKQAVLSKLYAEKQASLVPEHVQRNIDTALELYGHDPEEFSLSGQTKEASSVSSPRYLLPQYQRLAVRNRADIPSATESLLSQKHRLKTATLTDASVRLVKTASDFGMDVDDLPSDIYKYAGMTTCDAGVLLDWVEARAQACTSVEDRETFDKIAMAIRNNFPTDGILDDREELVKVAALIEEADKEAGLTPRYDRTLPDPVKTVFNMDKLAESTVDLGGQKIPLQKLLSVPADVYEEILGEGVIEAATGAEGQLDAEQFQALLKTLPADLKTLLAQNLGPYLK